MVGPKKFTEIQNFWVFKGLSCTLYIFCGANLFDYMFIHIETHFSHNPGDIWIFLDFIGPFVRLGDLHLVDFVKILKYTIDHILRTIFDLNMIFSGMIHLNEYFEIIKILFHNFYIFALFGGLEGKKSCPKSLFLAYFWIERPKNGWYVIHWRMYLVFIFCLHVRDCILAKIFIPNVFWKIYVLSKLTPTPKFYPI